jgi:hypothetical protein
MAAFPGYSSGSASALHFSRLTQRLLTLRLHNRGTPLQGPFTSKASAASSPPRLLRLLPAGATVAGWDLHPLKDRAFARRTENGVVGSKGKGQLRSPLLSSYFIWQSLPLPCERHRITMRAPYFRGYIGVVPCDSNPNTSRPTAFEVISNRRRGFA